MKMKMNLKLLIYLKYDNIPNIENAIENESDLKMQII